MKDNNFKDVTKLINEIQNNDLLNFFTTMGVKYHISNELIEIIENNNKEIVNQNLIIEDVFSMIGFLPDSMSRLVDGEIIKFAFNPEATLTGDKVVQYTMKMIDKVLILEQGKKEIKGNLALIVYDDGTYEMAKIEEELKVYYDILKCDLVDIVQLGHGLVMMLDDEGKFDDSKNINKAFQPYLPHDYIVGNIIVFREDGKGGFKDLHEPDMIALRSFIHEYKVRGQEEKHEDIDQAKKNQGITITDWEL